MATQPLLKLTPQEYLAIERIREYKSEYVNGEMFAMAGASKRHNLIMLNAAGELRSQLKGRPGHVYVTDMRVKVNPPELYTYPDVIVVCDQEQFEDQQEDTLLNPTMIIEVLSRTTETYDRGRKFVYYRKIESLREYILISQEMPLVECYVREPGSQSWLFSEANTLQDVVALTSINCRLILAEVYDKVELKG